LAGGWADFFAKRDGERPRQGKEEKVNFGLKIREIWPKSEFSQRNLWKNGC